MDEKIKENRQYNQKQREDEETPSIITREESQLFIL